MIVQYQSELLDRLFCKDVMDPAEGWWDHLLAFVFRSFSSTKPLKWPVPTFFFKLHVPELFLSLSLPLLSFLFFSLLLFLLLWCISTHFDPNSSGSSNVSWSSGKCQWRTGTKGIANEDSWPWQCTTQVTTGPGQGSSVPFPMLLVKTDFFTSIKRLGLIPKSHHFGRIVLVSISFSFNVCAWMWSSDEETILL